MAEYVRGFVIPEVADVHLAFSRVIRTAQEAVVKLRGTQLQTAAEATVAELRAAYVDFNDGLAVAARRASVEAMKAMRERLDATQVRPETDASPHLRDLLVARPLTVGKIETGMVGVADVAELDRAINPRTPSYGTYWRAQEYGTGQGEVPSQVGRVLFGYFMAAGGGDPTPPQAQYAGGGGPHPVFQSAGGQRNAGLAGGYIGQTRSGARGGVGGLGTIGVELRPRFFVKFGADAAAVQWRENIAAVQERAIERIAATSVV